MPEPFLALITPIGGGGGIPTHPIAPGGPPPGIWPSPGVPTQPIYIPPYPSTGPGFPTHPIAPGGQPPYPSQGPGFPTNPIAPGGQPPYPSQGPGFPTQPIYIPGPPPGIWPSPGHPAHPIAPGGAPPGIWPSPGVPTLPIYLPPSITNPGGEHPDQPINEPPTDSAYWTLVYIPDVGWVWAIVPPPNAPAGPTVTPHQ